MSANAHSSSPLTVLNNVNGHSKDHNHNHERSHNHDHSAPNPRHHPVDTTSTSSLVTLFTSLSPRADLLISTAHGGNHALQTTLIRSAIESRIPYFLPCEFGHDASNSRIRALLSPWEQRWLTITELRKQGEVEWLGLATGYPLSARLRDGNAGIDVQWHSASIYGGGGERFAASSTEFVGRLVLAVIRNWSRLPRNSYLCVAECVTSFDAVVAALERQLGVEFAVQRNETELAVRESEKRIKAGWPDAGVFLMERAVLGDKEVEYERIFERDAREVGGLLGIGEAGVEGLVNEVLMELRENGRGDCGCG